MLIYPITRHVNFDRLVTVESTRFPCCASTVFLFVMNKYLFIQISNYSSFTPSSCSIH